MNKLIELLLREPFLAVVAIGAILQVLGKVLGAIGKRGPATGSRPPTASPGGARTQAARPTARPSARQPSGAAGQTRMQPTQAEIAAEMRRILGLEQKAPERAQPQPQPQPPPLRRESGGERPPEPLRTQTFGGLNTPYESHIGDGLGKRRAPASSVGASKLGTLGGRSSGRMRRGRGGAHLVDLSNLPRAIVLREILDKPLGLRDLE